MSIAALYRPFTAIARTTRPTQRRDEEYDTTSVVLGDGGPDVPRRVRLAVDTQYIRPRDAENREKADIVCACLRVMKALRHLTTTSCRSRALRVAHPASRPSSRPTSTRSTTHSTARANASSRTCSSSQFTLAHSWIDAHTRGPHDVHTTHTFTPHTHSQHTNPALRLPRATHTHALPHGRVSRAPCARTASRGSATHLTGEHA